MKKGQPIIARSFIRRKGRPSPKGTHRLKSTAMRILFTCAGRRVQLIRFFRDAAASLRVKLEIHGADRSRLAPALHAADYAHVVPPLSSREYVARLTRLVCEHQINAVVPLIDTELPKLARAAENLEKLGCVALISPHSIVRTCQDKLAACRVLRKAGIDTPDTWLLDEVRARPRHHFPCVLKPRGGSAAIGVALVHRMDELLALSSRVRDPIVQEFVSGTEFTLDVYCGLDGQPRCVVPRRRLEIRAGEVSKGLVVKDPALMDVGRRVASALARCRGVINVQCIQATDGSCKVIEINPRFGGGSPLAIQAGADFPRWIIMELLGRTPRIRFDGFRDDVLMLRFDEAVFVESGSSLIENAANEGAGRS